MRYTTPFLGGGGKGTKENMRLENERVGRGAKAQRGGLQVAIKVLNDKQSILYGRNVGPYEIALDCQDSLVLNRQSELFLSITV